MTSLDLNDTVILEISNDSLTHIQDQCMPLTPTINTTTSLHKSKNVQNNIAPRESVMIRDSSNTSDNDVVKDHDDNSIYGFYKNEKINVFEEETNDALPGRVDAPVILKMDICGENDSETFEMRDEDHCGHKIDYEISASFPNVLENTQSKLTEDHSVKINIQASEMEQFQPKAKNEKRKQTNEELAYHFFVRQLVDKILDRRLNLSQQPSSKLAVIDEICQRQFPQFDNIFQRNKIRAYLKLCRRNHKKTCGVFSFKTTAQAPDAVRKLVNFAMEREKSILIQHNQDKVVYTLDSNAKKPIVHSTQSGRTTSSLCNRFPPFRPLNIQPKSQPPHDTGLSLMTEFALMDDQMIIDTAKVLVENVWTNPESAQFLINSLNLSAGLMLQTFTSLKKD